jgi:hypothetical protein
MAKNWVAAERQAQVAGVGGDQVSRGTGEAGRPGRVLAAIGATTGLPGSATFGPGGPGRTLNRPQTILHEAVHALAHVRGVKDTSRGGKYHNKREFVALAASSAWPGPAASGRMR